MRRAIAIATLLALSIPAPAFARGKFDPTTEFEQHDWIPIHLGPLNLSITKAVAYLLIGTALTILLGIGLMRSKLALLPDRRQTVGEALYEIAQTQIAEQGLPSKAIGRWFPYVATLLLFIFVVNLIGFIPLPLTGETYHGVPVWGIYAATTHPDPHLPGADLHLPVAEAHPGADPGDALLPLRGGHRRRHPGVYLRGPVSHLHRLGDRASTLGG